MTWSLTARDVPSLQEKEYGMVDVPQPPATVSWQKSKASGPPEQACVEVVDTHGHVWVRDSKNTRGPALGFTREGWAAFIIGVKYGEFNRSGLMTVSARS